MDSTLEHLKGTFWYLDSAVTITRITEIPSDRVVASIDLDDPKSGLTFYPGRPDNKMYSFEGYYSCDFQPTRKRWFWPLRNCHIIEVSPNKAWILGFSLMSPLLTDDCGLDNTVLNGFIDGWVGYCINASDENEETTTDALTIRYGNTTFTPAKDPNQGQPQPPNSPYHQRNFWGSMTWEPDFGGYGARVYVRGKSVENVVFNPQ